MRYEFGANKAGKCVSGLCVMQIVFVEQGE
jgi:hypothetical protein